MKNGLIAIIILSISCYNISKKNNISSQQVIGVTITDNFPNIDFKTGKLINYDTLLTTVCIYKHLKAFKLPYVFDSGVDGDILFSEKRSNYFVYKTGDSTGYFFKKINEYEKLPVDSILKKYSFSYIDPYSALYKKNESTLISSKTDSNSYALEEIYSFKRKEDTSVTGKTILYFIKADTSPVFSFSRELERTKKMRLVRIDYLNNKQYFKNYKYTLDAIEEFNTIEDMKESEKGEMLNYFSIYEKILVKKKN